MTDRAVRRVAYTAAVIGAPLIAVGLWAGYETAVQESLGYAMLCGVALGGGIAGTATIVILMSYMFRRRARDAFPRPRGFEVIAEPAARSERDSRRSS